MTIAAVHKRSFWMIAAMTAVVFLLNRCIQSGDEKTVQRSAAQYADFAGSASCKSCHAAVCDSFQSTYHHLTSAVASLQNIHGMSKGDTSHSFYFTPSLYVAVEKKEDSVYQTAYKDGVAKISRPFDFVIGSGKRGQTSLYWYSSYIFQLPLTWFTSANEWTNSPGYSNKVEFNRPVTSRCLECHSTYIKEITAKDAKADQFDRSRMILGVECEKCHGPGRQHVLFQQQNPGTKTAKYITNPARLSYLQQMDLCRLCHGGRFSKKQPSFSFQAGDKLADFFHTDSAVTNVNEMDVHGNQYGMLSASKCFKNGNLTCITCHNVHRSEQNNLEQFVQKCMGCHNNTHSCKLAGQMEPATFKNKCIDCHMPEEPSKAIMVLRQGETVPTSAYMRSHYIKVYPEVSNKIMSEKKQ